MIIKSKDNRQGKDKQQSNNPTGKDQLQGRDNVRLDKVEPTNNEGTAAWQNSETNYKVDQVNKPSIERVIDAKDWVDNGSRL